jgi:transcriptional regulator with XRE-family HTH domain
MIQGMRENEKPRNAASEAVIALRTAMGKTQATFAVEVLKSAVTTVARYETSHPPRGDVLLRLADVADQHQLYDISKNFRFLYLDGVKEALRGAAMFFVPQTNTQPAGGYLLPLRLEGADVVRGAQAFLDIIRARTAGDPEINKKAESALSALVFAAREINANPAGDDVKDALAKWSQGESAKVAFRKSRHDHEK